MSFLPILLVFIVYTADEEIIIMATKALNLKWDADELSEIKKVTQVFHMTLTDFFKEAAKEKLAELEKDPFYRLTMNAEDASPYVVGEGTLDHM